MMATMHKTNLSTMRALALLVLSIAIIAAGYTYQNHREAAVAMSATGTSTAQFSVLAPGQEQQTVSNTIVPPIAAEAIFTKPKYPTKLSFKGTFSAAEKAAIQKSYDKSVAALVKDPMDFNAWIDVGTLNMMSGNYALAETVWQFTAKQWPTNYVSHNNLGDLYMNYLRDYTKADAEFLAAIKNKRNDSNPYKNLFTLYSETSYKPTNTAAEDILKQGIAAVPNSVDMRVLLARWYKKLDRETEAKAAYQSAIDTATRLGQTTLAVQVKTEAGIK